MYTSYDVALCEAEIIPDTHPASAPNPEKNSVSLANTFIIFTRCFP